MRFACLSLFFILKLFVIFKIKFSELYPFELANFDLTVDIEILNSEFDLSLISSLGLVKMQQNKKKSLDAEI